MKAKKGLCMSRSDRYGRYKKHRAMYNMAVVRVSPIRLCVSIGVPIGRTEIALRAMSKYVRLQTKSLTANTQYNTQRDYKLSHEACLP